MSTELEILIVEGDVSQAKQIKRILEQHGHRVSVKQNTRLALAYMLRRKPKMVISAVCLPDLDGHSLCRQIKADENLKDIPVVLLTSLSDTKDCIRGLECGADGFIAEPYEPEILISRVEIILRNRELRGTGQRQPGFEIVLNGEKYSITLERQQMADLLISTYETAVQKNLELVRVQEELRSLNETLRGEVQDRTSELIEETTDRKLAERALVESEERLEHSQKMEAIGTLAGGIAHDFNNLLTAIIGNAQLALAGLQPEGQLYDRLIEIENSGNRAAELTRQLLIFSRRERLQPRTLDLNDTIRPFAKLLRRIVGEDIELRFLGGPGLSMVFADPGQIEQILMNLTVNARDAMPNGGEFLIETRNIVIDETFSNAHPGSRPGKHVQITVTDNGSGMDTATTDRIFEPFFTTKALGKGTGLGLALVYGIIKQHDGSIYVASEVGHGTTFNILLPALAKKNGKQVHKRLAMPRRGAGTILVAEDEEVLQRLVTDILVGLGYKVMMTADGEAAVQTYSEHREHIDLVLLDMVMPRMGGREAYAQIRALGCDVPVIFTSGYGGDQSQSRFVIETGASFIPKPYGLASLGIKVREALDAHVKALDAHVSV